MQLPLGKPGVSRFIFVALFFAFNWPLLSIPSRHSLLGWLFFFWGLTIALLFLAAHWNGTAQGEVGGGADDGQATGGQATGGQATGGQATGGQPEAGQTGGPEAQPDAPGATVPAKPERPEGGGGV